MKNRVKLLFPIPGIRGKLSMFTAFFVIVLICIISILTLNHEYKSLSESYDREIQPLRRYTEKIVLDLESLSNTFLLIENFRFRLKSKTKELDQFKQKIVYTEEKNWFTKNVLGKLNLIKKDLINTQSIKHIRVYNTYYSEYITDRIIKDLEENVRLQMKDEKGITITPLHFAEIQNLALKIEEIKIKTEDKNDELVILLANKKEKDENGEPVSSPEIIKNNYLIEEEAKIIYEDLNSLQSHLQTLKANLNSEILHFFYNSQKNNIRELGLNTEVIRIQSFNTTDTIPGFDTRIYADTNSLNSQVIVNHPLVLKDMEDRIKNSTQKEFLDSNFFTREVSVDDKDYEIYFRNILRKPHIIWRAKQILTETKKSKWKDFFKEDNELSLQFKALSSKLKNRLLELRQKKTIKPSLDKEFSNLYLQYGELLKKRQELINKFHPNKNQEINNFQFYKSKEKELNTKMIQLPLELNASKIKLTKAKQEEAKILNEEIFAKSEELKDAKSELSNIQKKILDWSHSKDLKVIDSFQYLRDAATYEYAILRTKNNSTDYSEYLESDKERTLMQLKWNTIREWIITANSEIKINPIYHDGKYINPFEGGVLSRSRSEVEEEMWKLDSTPIHYTNAEDELESVAMTQYHTNIAGFTRTIVDKSDGLTKIRSDIRKIIYSSSILGISAVIMAFLFSTLMVKNIRSISSNAQLVGKGFLNVQFEIHSRDEIGKLSDTLNKMVIGLIERDKVKKALGKFVNPQIAEKVLKQELKLGGERKNCAILFSDIRGFTSISEKLEPEEVVEFLNEYMTEMVDCVSLTDGIVDKFIGDAVMATWGAAFSHGNNAENAVNSAILMRKALIKFNVGRGTDKKPIIKIGCGINYGPVIAGQIGSEERLEYTVIGDAVNLASRLEALNKPMGTDILITEDLYLLVQSIFKTQKMQAIKVKGKIEPQTIYSVLGRIDDLQSPNSLEELRFILGIHFDSSKLINIDEKEEKFEILA